MWESFPLSNEYGTVFGRCVHVHANALREAHRDHEGADSGVFDQRRYHVVANSAALDAPCFDPCCSSQYNG